MPDPIARTTINELRALGGNEEPDFVYSLIYQFLEDLPRHLQSIEQAFQQHDSEALVKAAHTFKGSARYIGAFPLSRLCQQLENFGREQDFSAIEHHLPDIRTEIVRVREALQELCSRSTT